MGVEDPVQMMFLAKMFGTAIAVFFGICFCFGLFFGDKANIKPLSIPDKIDIGYISDLPSKNKNKSNEEINELKHRVQLLKLKKQLSDLEQENAIDNITKTSTRKVNPPTQNIDPKLFEDCTKTLIALGEKKSSAKKIVFDYLSENKNIKTVEEFILGVFKK